MTAQPPADGFFPIAFVVTNDFRTATNVTIGCTVRRFLTDNVDFMDTDLTSREVVPTLAKGSRRAFHCQAPAELTSPVQLADVRGARVSVDVIFSVPYRWRRLGVRQGFDLVIDKARGASWQAAAPALRR